MLWKRWARKEYQCDICKNVIKKRQDRIVLGSKFLFVCTRVDANYHHACFLEAAEVLTKLILNHGEETNMDVYSSRGVCIPNLEIKKLYKEIEKGTFKTWGI